jgi:hypothetical protein
LGLSIPWIASEQVCLAQRNALLPEPLDGLWSNISHAPGDAYVCIGGRFWLRSTFAWVVESEAV